MAVPVLKVAFLALVPLGALDRPSAQPATAAVPGISRPRIDWPLREGYRRIYPDKVVVLSPRYFSPGRNSDDPILTYAGGRVEALHPTTGQPLWPEAVAVEAEPILLKVDHERCLLASPRRVFSLAIANGSLQWSYGDDTADGPLADPESQPTLREAAVAGGVIAVASDAELIGLDQGDGGVRWSKKLEAAPIFVEAAGRDGTVLCLTHTRGRFRLLTIAAHTGRLVAEATGEEADRPAALLPLSAQTCAVAFSSALWLLDSRAPRLVTRIPAVQPLRTAGLHAVGGRLVVVAGDGSVACYQPGFEQARWTYRVPLIRDSLLWSEANERLVLVAAGQTVMAVEAVSGRQRWRQRLPESVADLELALVDDSLLICRRDSQRVNGARNRRYRLQRLDLEDGRYAGVDGGGDLVSCLVSSFGGMFAYDGALILLDGRTLIGYVSAGNGRPPSSAAE